MSSIERQLLARVTDVTELAKAHSLGVRTEHFEESVCKAIWDFVCEYWHNSQSRSAPTRWVIQEEFSLELPETDVEVSYLAEKLRTRFATNRLQEILNSVADKTASDPIGTLAQLKNSVNAASEQVVQRITRVNLADNVEERIADYEKREETGGEIGIPYGIELLDQKTGGLMPGELAVVGAIAKTGKTMMGLHVSVNVVKLGLRVMIFSLEMSLKEIGNRIDALYSGVSYDKLLHGTLSPSELQTLREGQERLRDEGGVQIEMPPEGERTVATLLSRAHQYGTEYLFIDQLSHMEPGKSTRDLKEHHGTIMKQLSNGISVPGAEIPCLLAAQMRRGDEVITQESFANAAEIERECDIMLGLSRNKDLRDNHCMQLDILGSRRSDTARILLEWELQRHTRIRSIEEMR